MECPTFRANNQLNFHNDIIDKRKFFNTHLNVRLKMIQMLGIFQGHVFYLRGFNRFLLKTLSNLYFLKLTQKKIYLPVVEYL